MLTSGQADFEVAHEPGRAFRVIAGLAEIIDLGTNFDVRLEHDSTVVTVVEGRVTVGPSALLETLDTNLSQHRSPRFVQLRADQQISVADGKWPATPIAIDGRGTTAWLLRQMVFEHEPLERVAAEYNRYSAKPIEIVTPALRSLPISGVFSTDDTDAFIAFLRSLKRVRVEVTQTQIRVVGNLDVAAPLAPNPAAHDSVSTEKFAMRGNIRQTARYVCSVSRDGIAYRLRRGRVRCRSSFRQSSQSTPSSHVLGRRHRDRAFGQRLGPGKSFRPLLRLMLRLAAQEHSRSAWNLRAGFNTPSTSRANP